MTTWRLIGDAPTLNPGSETAPRVLVYGPTIGMHIGTVGRWPDNLGGELFGGIEGFHGSMRDWGVTHFAALPEKPA